MKTNNMRTKSKKSLVADRLAYFEGKNVSVKIRSEIGSKPEEFKAIYRSTHPFGRIYLMEFIAGGKKRVIQSESLLEISEIDSSL